MTGTKTSAPLVSLHLSDIHFGQEKGEAVVINQDARDQLVRKVREIAQARQAAREPPIGNIIITGDISYSGRPAQFDDAVGWLAEVSNAAGCDPLSVQVVPGNHDVDRGNSPMVIGMIEQLFRFGRNHLDKVLGSEDDRTALYNRLRAYQAFANGFGCKLDTEGGNAGVKEHVLAPGRTLRIVGLNSALMCCGKENNKKPKLLLGARQRVIPEVDDVEYIILVHHPMSWLRDGADTQNYIDNRARILMCGHEHKPNVELRSVEGNGQLLVIDAGATVPDLINEDYTYVFNVIEIDLTETRDAIDVVVDTYKWKQTELRFHQDTTAHEDGAPRRYRLPCPKFAARTARENGVAAPASEAGAKATALAEIPEVPIEAIDMAPASKNPTDDVRQFAQARGTFFHNLSVPQRLAVLVKLKAIPENIETLSSNIMLRQLDQLHRQGRAAELAAAIAEAQKTE